MNIQTLSKDLNQKYIKDIDSSVGKVGPYYFIVEPSSQIGLIRVSFSVQGAQEHLVDLQEAMAHFRAIGRDGVRTSNEQLILECKINGLDHAEEFASILETVGNILHDHDVPQVDYQGNAGDNLGVFRVGTKLEVHTDETIQQVSATVQNRYKNSNQSRPKAFFKGFGWFLLLSPLYIIVRAYEPSFMGFVIFSFMVLLGMFRKSLSQVYRYWTPSKADLGFLLLGYVICMYLINVAAIVIFPIFAAISSGNADKILLLLQIVFVNSFDIFISSAITLAFAMAFNYHIVRSLIDGATGSVKPVKRSIHRVL